MRLPSGMWCSWLLYNNRKIMVSLFVRRSHRTGASRVLDLTGGSSSLVGVFWGDGMRASKPSKDQVLGELAENCLEPLPVLEFSAFPTAFIRELSVEARDLVESEVVSGNDGWSVGISRRWKLESPGLVVAVSAGADPDVVLACLDRIREEIVRRPEVVTVDWSRPNHAERPRLRVIPGGNQSSGTKP